MPRGTKSFQKQKNGDDHKVLPIMSFLTGKGWHCFREPVIEHGMFSTRNHIRRPDIKIVQQKFEVYIEIDGKVHGDLEMPTLNTLKRNMDYDMAHKNYIIINEELAKFFNLDIQQLASYRVSEEYSKFLARLENGSMYL